MKVECVKQKLKEAVTLSERSTGKKLALPVLQYVLLLAAENTIKLRATNLDIGIEVSIPARVITEGIVAVPGEVLSGVLGYLSDEKNITLELIGENLTLTNEHQSTVIKCSSYEDFPTLPLVTKGEEISLDSKLFLNGLKAVVYSASLNEMKPEFSSIYCYSEHGYLVFAATDSSRLAEKKIAVKNLPENIHLLIPLKNTIEVIRTLENTQGSIKLIISKSQITIYTEHIQLTSRLVDGNFPDYKQIIPKQHSTEIVLLKEDLLNAIRLGSIFSGKLQQIRVSVRPEEKIFSITSRQEEIGENTTQITATLKGDPIELLFNQKYLLDVIQYLPQDSLVLYFNGPGKPLIIRGVGEQTFLYLIMPMRVV